MILLFGISVIKRDLNSEVYKKFLEAYLPDWIHLSGIPSICKACSAERTLQGISLLYETVLRWYFVIEFVGSN